MEPFQEQQKSIFRKKPPIVVSNQPSVDLSIRLRTLEDRFSNFQRRLQLNEENMIKSDRKINNDLHDLFAELTDVKQHMEQLGSKMDIMVKQLEFFARKSDVEVLGKYISIWDPTRFVTQNEIDKIVDYALERKSHHDKKV